MRNFLFKTQSSAVTSAKRPTVRMSQAKAISCWPTCHHLRQMEAKHPARFGNLQRKSPVPTSMCPVKSVKCQDPFPPVTSFAPHPHPLPLFKRKAKIQRAPVCCSFQSLLCRQRGTGRERHCIFQKPIASYGVLREGAMNLSLCSVKPAWGAWRRPMGTMDHKTHREEGKPT